MNLAAVNIGCTHLFGLEASLSCMVHLLATTQVDLEGVMVSELNQAEKDKYRMVSLVCGILKQNKKKTKIRLIETETKGMIYRRDRVEDR